MQALKLQLENITRTLATLSATDVTALDDAKSLKSVVYVADRVLELLDLEVGRLHQLRLRALSRLADRVEVLRPELERAEAKFLIKYATRERVERPLAPRGVMIEIAGMQFHSQMYSSRDEIPIMSYGAIMIRGLPVIAFRYSVADWVSVSSVTVTDYSPDNMQTVCCGNGPTCEYGERCRYYHDPIEWPESQHQQRFARTSMVKKCPTFGNSPVTEPLRFEHLRTLARYCAIQALMIHLVATHP